MSSGICKLNNEISLYIYQAKIQNIGTPNTSEDVNQQELSGVTDGNAKWYNHTGRQFGSFL